MPTSRRLWRKRLKRLWRYNSTQYCKIQIAMNNKHILWMYALLMLIIGMSSCDGNDDDSIVGTGLIGKWRFVDHLNRPSGVDAPRPHTMEIIETDSLQNYMKRTGGTILYSIDNGRTETLYWNILPKNDSIHNLNYPIFFIQYVTKGYEGEPYAYEVDGTHLRLRHLGPNFTDPVSETLVYRRISN